MSYPPPRSRSSSGADRYRPDDYPPARSSPPQAPQTNGFLAPGSPSAAPLAMPEPYQPSPLSNGASNGPAFQPQSLPNTNSYLHPHGGTPAGTPGAPPYPLADPPRPRSYSNSSQRSYHSQHSRRSSHGQSQQQQHQVRFDDRPEHFESRPAHTGPRHSHSGVSGRRDESPRHHHHHSSHHDRRDDDYDDFDRGHHHHDHHHSSGGSHGHHGRHDSFADDGGKPLKRTDTHRPTLGDTVVSLVSGLKDYISR